MTGYEEEAPEGFELADGMNYNHYFAGNQIAMPPPLFEGAVEYVDGTEPSVEQMAADPRHWEWLRDPDVTMTGAVTINTLRKENRLLALPLYGQHTVNIEIFTRSTLGKV